MRAVTNRTFGHFLAVFPVAIAFVSLAATFIGAHLVSARDASQVRAGTDAEARHVAGQLTAGLNQAFEPLQRLAAWWLLQGQPLAKDDWETDAQLFVRARSGLQMIVWLDPRGNRSWSVRPGLLPDTGKVEAPDPALTTAVAEARRINTTAVSPVFDSAGKSLVYASMPIRSHGRLRGYVAGLYDVAELIRSLLVSQLSDQYTVTVTANGHAFRAPAAARAAASAESERRAPVALGNTAWSVAVAPAAAVTTMERSIMSFGVLASALLYLSAVFARSFRRRASDMQAVNARLVFENQERRRAEEQVAQLNRDLQRKLEEFQTLMDVLPVGIAVAEDAECRRIWTNRALAAMLHLPVGHNVSLSASVTEKPPYQLLRNGIEVPPDELPMQVAARTQAPVANHYLDIVRSDRSVLHTLSYSAPLFDENGKVRGVINSCVDITGRKRLEDRLQEVQRYESLALMAGGIAHDFNNLLTVIIGNAASIAIVLPRSGDAAGAIADLQAAATRAAELVAQLLAFTGRFWCELKPVALSAEIEKMMPHIRTIVPPAVSIRYDLAAALPLIKAGSAELGQVVDSIVSNAAEALGHGEPGPIQIRTSLCELSARGIQQFYPDWQLSPGPYVCLEVTDTGSGIPQEIVARVFDPFFTTKFVGRGLGLSAVQGIVRAHGGAIRLDSTLHHGTRVELIFPTYTPTPAPHVSNAAVPARMP